MTDSKENGDSAPPTNFIRQIIDEDLKSGKHERIVTRFPPEPNGYLHIGHSKAIWINFGIAHDYGGHCFLRFDDTNPVKEEEEYIESIKRDIRWLGYDWEDRLTHASGYFDKLYDYAVQLIKDGNAYVDSLSPEQIREYRGTLTEAGKESPYRNRSVEENLDLLERMRAGEFDEGSHVVRAKIDMASPNMNMRDPTIYRILKASHHQTGDKWKIYPMYDFTHCLSDAEEGITHSLCSLEFEDHRPLYDWFIDQLPTPSRPRQIEFARLNVNYTITSKRKLKRLVDEGFVDGWDDPRMPTLCGMRRRGYTPASLRNFCERVGVTKSDSVVDLGMLEHAVREDLDGTAPRAMCVLRPLKVIIENYPEDKSEDLTAPVHPQKPEMGERKLPFARQIYIDRNDFMEDPPSKYFRLAPGREVRLRNAYVIRCDDVIKNDAGEIIELRCSYDPETLGKKPEGRKVKGIVHWVSAAHGRAATVRLYDRLFNVENPAQTREDEDFTDNLNPESLEVLEHCVAEPELKNASPEDRFQFERQGYFVLDPESTPDNLLFNRTVTLKDTWAKIAKKQGS